MKILKPRRGRKSTALEQNFILRKGEVFFEVPESGTGTGMGKLKVGDGETTYNKLPYFFEKKEYDIPMVSKGNNGIMFKDDKEKLDTISNNANYYKHSESPGNKHIPSGGSTGQVLKWNADGEAKWETQDIPKYNNVSIYSDGMMNKEDKVKLNSIADYANNIIIDDNLSSNNQYNALSSNQGRILNENINGCDYSATYTNNKFNETINNIYNNFRNRGIYPASNNVNDIANAIKSNMNEKKAFILGACGYYNYSYFIGSYNDSFVSINGDRTVATFKRDAKIIIDSCNYYGHPHLYVNDVDQGEIFTQTLRTKIYTPKEDFTGYWYTGTISIRAGSNIKFKTPGTSYWAGVSVYLA